MGPAASIYYACKIWVLAFMGQNREALRMLLAHDELVRSARLDTSCSRITT